MKPKVLSFSGGLTSGYMLRREIDRIEIDEYRKQFTTIFCNTGKEHDVTLDVTHEQVALVASGQERTVSHPIIARIMAELREEGVRIAN